MVTQPQSLTIGAVMPHYQQWDFIRDAIESVIHEVDMLVMVDDGSDDFVGNIRYLEEEFPQMDVRRLERNWGTATAINEGIAVVKQHPWLTWVSSDNTYRVGWGDKLKSLITPDTGVVYSAYKWTNPHSGKYFIGGAPYDPGLLILNPSNCYFGPCFIIRQDVWQKAGPHRGLISHDYDHWLRVEEVCWDMGLDIVHTSEVLCDYCAHDKRVTVTRRKDADYNHWRDEALKRRG